MKTKNEIMSNKKDCRNANTLRSSIKRLLQITVFSAVVMASTNAFACEGEDLQRTRFFVDASLHEIVQTYIDKEAQSKGLKVSRSDAARKEAESKLDWAIRQLPLSCRPVYDKWMASHLMPPSAPVFNPPIFDGPVSGSGMQSQHEIYRLQEQLKYVIQ